MDLALKGYWTLNMDRWRQLEPEPFVFHNHLAVANSLKAGRHLVENSTGAISVRIATRTIFGYSRTLCALKDTSKWRGTTAQWRTSSAWNAWQP
jgi:hypothetical protein